MPKRAKDWYDDKGNLSLSIFIKNNPHDTRIMSIFSKIDSMRRQNGDMTKSDVLLQALEVWAGLDLPPSDSELLNILIDMVGTMQRSLDDLQADIDQLAAQGVQVQGIQQRADQLRESTDRPAALGGMFDRFAKENEG